MGGLRRHPGTLNPLLITAAEEQDLRDLLALLPQLRQLVALLPPVPPAPSPTASVPEDPR